MPKTGWTSISVSTELYKLAKKYYEENKEELKVLYGIRSFSAFVNMCIREYLVHLGALNKKTAEDLKAKIE